MDKDNSLTSWGVKVCPIRSKACMKEQCAWWLEDENMCSMKKR
ncbi:MAG: hypothetical protein ABIJ27_07360 [Candidatus Omnitrophota bacterium]